MTKLSIPPIRRVAARRAVGEPVAADSAEWITRGARLLTRSLLDAQDGPPAEISAKILAVAELGYDSALNGRPCGHALTGCSIISRNVTAWGEDLTIPATRQRFTGVVETAIAEVLDGA